MLIPSEILWPVVMVDFRMIETCEASLLRGVSFYELPPP